MTKQGIFLIVLILLLIAVGITVTYINYKYLVAPIAGSLKLFV